LVIYYLKEKAPTYQGKSGTNNQGASTTPISTPSSTRSGQKLFFLTPLSSTPYGNSKRSDRSDDSSK
jgi:hypothetical protein